MSFNEGLIGKRARISVVNETSFGSGGDMAANGYVLGYDCIITPNWIKNWMEILAAGADSRAVQGRVLGPKALPFDLEFTITDWRFMKWLCYSVVDSAPPAPITHTFTIANEIQSFKLEWAWRKTSGDPIVMTLTGCFCLSGRINFQKGSGEGSEGFIKAHLSCYATDYDIGTSVSSVPVNEREPFLWYHTQVTINNSTIAEINSGHIEIDNGINPEEHRYCNTSIGREIGEPVPIVHNVSGSYNVNLFDNTLIDLWDSKDIITNCQLSFIQDADNKIDMTFGEFRSINTWNGEDYTGIKKADFVFNSKELTSLISVDDIEDY